MGNDPLSNFLQNGTKPLAHDAVPVNYKVQQAAQPAKIPGLLDRLNPMNWLKSQIQSNPEMQQVMDVINENGGDAKTAFYNECKKRNADPDQILEQVKNHPLFKQFMK